MKKIKISLFFALFLVLLVTGCKKNSTEPEEQTTNKTSNASGQPMPSFNNQTDVNGVMASIYYYMASPIPQLPDIGVNLGFATFGDGVDAGTVKLNSTAIGKIAQSGKFYYLFPNPANPGETLNLNWNGANHSWAVNGANGIPAITASVSSPNEFNVTSPVANASVSKSSGLQVKWSGSSSTTKVLVQIISLSQGTKVSSYQELSDNGSYTIPAGDLSSFNGDCMLYVVKYNYSISTVSGKKYVAVAEIVKNLKVKIN